MGSGQQLISAKTSNRKQYYPYLLTPEFATHEEGNSNWHTSILKCFHTRKAILTGIHDVLHFLQEAAK
jgi:hypothetical protein